MYLKQIFHVVSTLLDCINYIRCSLLWYDLGICLSYERLFAVLLLYFCNFRLFWCRVRCLVNLQLMHTVACRCRMPPMPTSKRSMKLILKKRLKNSRSGTLLFVLVLIGVLSAGPEWEPAVIMMGIVPPSSFSVRMWTSSELGGSVAEWLACRTQAPKSTGSNCSRDAVE